MKTLTNAGELTRIEHTPEDRAQFSADMARIASQRQHTPGPWKVEPTDQGALSDRFKGVPFSINGRDGFQPCLIMGDGRLNRGTAEANARLIAAAPELLAACKNAERELLRAAYNTESHHAAAARKLTNVIAKAEGRQS